MNTRHSAMVALVVAFAPFASVSLAQAQATRTWVSGVGSDVNPCSRTAPCQTFAGAISKTATGGEINAIDPGGFGAVTITKAITIDGGGTFASVLATGTNGIIVNAPSDAVVTLRNLSVDGAGSGLNGIRFLAGGSLNIENVSIFNFINHGVDVNLAGFGTLSVINTTITDCDVGINMIASTGILVASIDRSRVHECNTGVLAWTGTRAAVRDSDLSMNRSGNAIGLQANTGAEVNVERSLFAYLSIGILASGSTVRIANNTVMNAGTGLATAGGGQIISFGNNNVTGNSTDGMPTSTVVPR